MRRQRQLELELQVVEEEEEREARHHQSPRDTWRVHTSVRLHPCG